MLSLCGECHSGGPGTGPNLNAGPSLKLGAAGPSLRLGAAAGRVRERDRKRGNRRGSIENLNQNPTASVTLQPADLRVMKLYEVRDDIDRHCATKIKRPKSLIQLETNRKRNNSESKFTRKL